MPQVDGVHALRGAALSFAALSLDGLSLAAVLVFADGAGARTFGGGAGAVFLAGAGDDTFAADAAGAADGCDGAGPGAAEVVGDALAIVVAAAASSGLLAGVVAATGTAPGLFADVAAVAASFGLSAGAVVATGVSAGLLGFGAVGGGGASVVVLDACTPPSLGAADAIFGAASGVGRFGAAGGDIAGTFAVETFASDGSLLDQRCHATMPMTTTAAIAPTIISGMPRRRTSRGFASSGDAGFGKAPARFAATGSSAHAGTCRTVSSGSGCRTRRGRWMIVSSPSPSGSVGSRRPGGAGPFGKTGSAGPAPGATGFAANARAGEGSADSGSLVRGGLAADTVGAGSVATSLSRRRRRMTASSERDSSAEADDSLAGSTGATACDGGTGAGAGSGFANDAVAPDEATAASAPLCGAGLAAEASAA
jgi:hypothetical protein